TGQCVFNAGVEGSLSAPCLIETEQGLYCDIRVVDRLSERTACKSPQDLFRTWKLVGRTGRTTHKNAAAAWRISGSRSIEWTRNRDSRNAERRCIDVVQVIDSTDVTFL